MEPYQHSMQPNWFTELLTRNLKLIYLRVINLTTELLQFCCYIVSWASTIKVKVDRSLSSVFRIFSHCQRNQKVKSTVRVNERFPASGGVFSLVFGERDGIPTARRIPGNRGLC